LVHYNLKLLNLNKSFNLGQISRLKSILNVGDSHIEKISGKHGFINVSTLIAFNKAGRNLFIIILFSNMPIILDNFSKNSTFFFDHWILNSLRNLKLLILDH